MALRRIFPTCSAVFWGRLADLVELSLRRLRLDVCFLFRKVLFKDIPQRVNLPFLKRLIKKIQHAMQHSPCFLQKLLLSSPSVVAQNAGAIHFSDGLDGKQLEERGCCGGGSLQLGCGIAMLVFNGCATLGRMKTQPP